MADSDLDKIDTGVPSDAENPVEYILTYFGSYTVHLRKINSLQEAEKVDTAGAAGGLISSGVRFFFPAFDQYNCFTYKTPALKGCHCAVIHIVCHCRDEGLTQSLLHIK